MTAGGREKKGEAEGGLSRRVGYGYNAPSPRERDANEIPGETHPTPMSRLNPRQAEAVRHVGTPLLVLAGAGSGKTRVITHKIAWLIGERGMEPRHIAAVTFTNKAAREMKERVQKLMKGREPKGLRISTFHSLGLAIARQEHRRLGIRRDFTLFDSHDTLGLIRELMKREHGAADEVERVRWRISQWKNAYLTPEEAEESAVEPWERLAAHLYAEYDRKLRAFSALDLDDLIVRPARLLDEEPEALAAWRERIRYLLVDEYQDTNATQYRLVHLLAAERGGLTVVGDDDQSVYGWRGARPENLFRLKEDFPDLTVIKLEQNYRSTGRILRAANTLIENNPHVYEKRLWSELGPGDPIRVMVCRDGEHETERVVSQLIHHRFRHNNRYGDYAILYRGNHQARPLERMLREHRIPYLLSGGASFFDRAEIKDLLAYLRLLVNPDDDAAFLRVVNTPRRGVGAAGLEKLAGFARHCDTSLFGALFEPGMAEAVGGRTAGALESFGRMIVELGDRGRRGDPVAAARDVVEQSRYREWLQEQAPDPQAAERRLENVAELLDWLQRMAERAEGEPDLAELLAQVTLIDMLDREEEKEPGDAVRLMTLHAAKGLEFDHVFLVGLEEGLLPHRNSLDEGGIEEERRLAYVGITRARRTLTLSLARSRNRYGERVECEPSRFLEELPEEDLHWDGQQEESPDERKARGRAHVAHLRDMLKSG